MVIVMMKPTFLNVDMTTKIAAKCIVTELCVKIVSGFCYIIDETDKLICNADLYNPTLGDKYCDFSLNNVENYFDVGDCCLPNIKCLSQSTRFLMPCPDMVCIQSNIYCVPEELGDGVCQDYNNGPYCNYDLGDCCLVPGNLTECCHCVCHGNSLNII